ncbi:delta-sarcoglycan-like isoform X2 [Pararge aegeria]|uniref:delta-sarcoglycan-like isoform X2 n=1 Tax=Pararge aegeria TaxID=116150 RepID=UPI0019D17092|nr:delta-sarcoglycan-like isoform X2 [Pararge aegeria]
MKVEDTATEGIRGWGCTPTGDHPPAVVTNSSTTEHSSGLPIWITRGWKRNLLYGIIVFLMRGIGPITIVKDGVHLAGQVWVVDKLVASTISSQAAQTMTLHSHRNFSVLVSEPGQVNLAKLVIKRDTIECSGQVFEIRDAKGGEVFYASREEVRVSADTLNLDGAGGLTVKSALQTPVVRAPPGSDLQLESLTRRLDLRAPQSIFFESRAGGISITSHSNITLKSDVGAIKIHASNIIINNLKEAAVTDVPNKKSWGKKVYQLCACASGKLFLAAPDSICAMQDHETELCR